MPAVYLDPSFTEALMGFPIGWTVLARSETLSFLPLLSVSGSHSGEPSKEKQTVSNEAKNHLIGDLQNAHAIASDDGVTILGYCITIVIAGPDGRVNAAHAAVALEDHRALVGSEVVSKTIQAFPDAEIDEEEDDDR